MKTKPLTFILALTFLFLFSGSVFGQEEVKKEYWDNGKLKSKTHYKNGKKDGLLTICYETGAKEVEIYFKNGKSEGLLTTAPFHRVSFTEFVHHAPQFTHK